MQRMNCYQLEYCIIKSHVLTCFNLKKQKVLIIYQNSIVMVSYENLLKLNINNKSVLNKFDATNKYTIFRKSFERAKQCILNVSDMPYVQQY